MDRDRSGAGLGGGLPGMDTDGQTEDQTDGPTGDGPDQAGDEVVTSGEDDGPLDPVLPNTGGPSAVFLPVALGLIVVGSVVLTRRRRTAL